MLGSYCHHRVCLFWILFISSCNLHGTLSVLQRLFIIQHPLKNCERVIRLCAVLLVSIITSDIIISKFRDSISPAYMAARHKECVTANCFWELKKKRHCATCLWSQIPVLLGRQRQVQMFVYIVSSRLAKATLSETYLRERDMLGIESLTHAGPVLCHWTIYILPLNDVLSHKIPSFE